MTASKVGGGGGWVGLVIVGVVVAGGTAIALHLQSESTSEVSGALTIDDVRFEPRHCRSGKIEEDGPHDRPRFHGVELLGAGGNGRMVRVLDDPTDGPTVIVVDGGDAPRPVDRAACERFDVDLRETDELIMEVWGFDGSIALDCPTITGQVRFQSCYSGR